MNELYEELKYHELIKVHFTSRRYMVVTVSGEEISTSTPEIMVKLLMSLRYKDIDEGSSDIQLESLSNHKHHFINGTCVECLKSE